MSGVGKTSLMSKNAWHCRIRWCCIRRFKSRSIAKENRLEQNVQRPILCTLLWPFSVNILNDGKRKKVVKYLEDLKKVLIFNCHAKNDTSRDFLPKTRLWWSGMPRKHIFVQNEHNTRNFVILVVKFSKKEVWLICFDWITLQMKTFVTSLYNEIITNYVV